MVLTFYEGLLAEGRERRAEGRVQRAKRYIFPHFTRGLRLHRYFCVALRGFWQRAESEGRRTEGRGRRVYFSAFYEGLTPPSLFLCRPKGLLAEGRERRAEGLFFRILRGAYATIAIIVSP
jgi:hypothetical protein